MEPTYSEQLARLLKPQTEPEHRTVDYVAAVTKLQAPTLLGMIERAISTARAEGYEHGWAEGVQHGRKGGSA